MTFKPIFLLNYAFLVYKGVECASSLVVLLQYEDLLPRLGQDGRSDEAAWAAAHHDGVQVRGDLLDGKVLLYDLVPLALGCNS